MNRAIGWLSLLAIGGCASSAATIDEPADGGCPRCGGGDDIPEADAAGPPVPRCTPSAWELEPIDAWPETVVITPLRPSVRVSGDGSIEVAYLTSVFGDAPARRGHRAPAGGWSVEELPGAADSVGDAVTPDGFEHTCLTERTATGHRLVCAERATGGAWTSSIVDDSTSVGVSLATAPDGTLYVAYVDAVGVALAVRPPTGAWTTAPLGLHWAGPIAVDGDGCLHAVEGSQWPETALLHAFRCGGGAWTTEVVLPATVNVLVTPRALAIDGAGVVHLVYVEAVAGPHLHLFHARRALDATWTVVEVPEIDVLQDSPSIAIDPDGGAHTVFSGAGPDDDVGHFYHLRLDGTGTPEAFGPTDPDGGSTALAIDATGALHAVLDHGAKRLDHARSCSQ
jgi:hypothetical protein